MRSKVHNILKVVGRQAKGIGDAMPHAMDGAYDGGKVGKDERHRVKIALHKLRLRATGMTDSIFGSKETGGAFENDFEQQPGK